jgi:prevent-host-death family protein
MSEASYGSFEAKNKLSELLVKVEKGESVVITRRDQPVARLIPYREQGEAEGRRHWLSTCRQIRQAIAGRAGGTLTARELIEEGRKY